MMRWKCLGLGAAAFLVSHLVEVEMWSSWFGGNGLTPWFLNSARAGAFTAVSLALVAGFAAARDAGEATVRGVNVGLGAAAAMVVVLFVVGPGTLFPIALAIGLAVVESASVGGALAGASLKGAASARRPSADS
jgi:hypothetical protein